ncbi:hypothetical protein HT746_20975 [Burkholderia pyrrocinia]|uniref:hypothetical protein n=1 Tax=Burkholderia pyrrocinia TaxID=60550 RepID=UPI00157508A3|nr:hypothetical protein [Burkholderia pyrrocinia]NTX29566.1 hypothetical protein [Burkholderia pyrrocinia]QVN19273.1 hypothetical protein JYG32_05960 [Burkholderia pyrrocinia]
MVLDLDGPIADGPPICGRRADRQQADRLKQHDRLFPIDETVRSRLSLFSLSLPFGIVQFTDFDAVKPDALSRIVDVSAAWIAVR